MIERKQRRSKITTIILSNEMPGRGRLLLMNVEARHPLVLRRAVILVMEYRV